MAIPIGGTETLEGGQRANQPSKPPVAAAPACVLIICARFGLKADDGADRL